MKYEKVRNKVYVIPEKMSCNKESYNYKILNEENLNYANHLIGATDKFYRYEQRGKTLKEWFASNKFKSGDLVKIILSINDMLSEAENYLLSENDILLDFESISIYKGNYQFIVLPNHNGDFSYELSKFIIRILRHCDANDNDSLTLAYNLFVKSSKPNYTINDLVWICEQYMNDGKVMEYEK